VIWVGIITVIFCLPFTPAAVPWNDDFDWNAVNYAPLTVGGLILAVGIWWLVSARKSFTGPVRTVKFAGEGLVAEGPGPAPWADRASGPGPPPNGRGGACGTKRRCSCRTTTSMPCSGRAGSR